MICLTVLRDSIFRASPARFKLVSLLRRGSRSMFQPGIELVFGNAETDNSTGMEGGEVCQGHGGEFIFFSNVILLAV
jgi:hypothetical protein